MWPCPGLKSLHQSLFDAFSCLHREQEAARSTGTVAAGREAQPVWDSHLFSCCSLQKKDEAGVGESRGFPGLQRVPDPDRIPQGGRGGHAGVEMDSALVPVGLGALRGSRRRSSRGSGCGHGPCAGVRPLAGGGRSRAWPRVGGCTALFALTAGTLETHTFRAIMAWKEDGLELVGSWSCTKVSLPQRPGSRGKQTTTYKE